jgi:subtilisin-like proprotein convertase family protein
MRATTLIFTVALGLTLPASVLAVPPTLAVQAVIQSGGGGPAADGVYDMTFALYKDAKTGPALWQEGPLPVAAKGGVATHTLGSVKPLDPKLGAEAQLFVGVTIDPDPELPRKPLHSVLYAFRSSVAEGLQCSGCVTAQHLDPKVLEGLVKQGDLAKVALSGQYSDLQGGPDLSPYAKLADLAAYAKLDGLADVAKSGAYGDLKGGPVLAKLGIACGTGLVMRGIKADGSYDCVEAAAKPVLPNDGLSSVSNGLMTDVFSETFASAAPVDIPDHNDGGVKSGIQVADVGLVQSLEISVDIANSDLKTLTVTLADPAGGQHVLFDKGKAGDALKATYPKPDPPVSGDLGAWAGKNPKGPWTLLVVDSGFLNNKTDGQVKAWSVKATYVSNKKVAATGGFQFQVADSPPVACAPQHFGLTYANSKDKTLYVCNGAEYFPLLLDVPGTEKNPAVSCKEIVTKLPASKSGVFWLKTAGAPYQAYCDMTTAGGGWTLVMKLSAGSFCYGSGNWTNGQPMNADKLLDPGVPPSSGAYDAKSVGFYTLPDVTALRLVTSKNAETTVTFVAAASPQKLMTTNDVDFLTYPNYAQWVGAFGHDRAQAPIFMRAGVPVKKGNTCRNNPDSTPSGCGKPCTFCYQAADGNCCGCAVNANDVNSGIGQNSEYCGGGQGNCSTAGQWSDSQLRTVVWAR